MHCNRVDDICMYDTCNRRTTIAPYTVTDVPCTSSLRERRKTTRAPKVHNSNSPAMYHPSHQRHSLTDDYVDRCYASRHRVAVAPMLYVELCAVHWLSLYITRCIIYSRVVDRGYLQAETNSSGFV